MAHALNRIPNSDADYALRPSRTSVRVRVDQFVIQITRATDGVVTEIYPAGFEMNEPLDSAYAPVDKRLSGKL